MWSTLRREVDIMQPYRLSAAQCLLTFFYYSVPELFNYRHAATPPHNKLGRNLTECFNINITLARLNCKLPDDGRRPKHAGAI